MIGKQSLHLLREFVAAPKKIGAIAPSSSFLARKMVQSLDLKEAQAVVEYGPGTGAFTKVIARRVCTPCSFVAIEMNASLARQLRGRFANVTVYEDSVENVEAICAKEGIDQVDCIISGLPWASFSANEQERLLDAMHAVLKPRGQFVTFAYLHALVLPGARNFRKVIKSYFGEVDSSKIVWRNVPPALVYRCRR